MKSIIKTTTAKVIANAAEKMARKAAGTASHFGTYQFKEPAKLKKIAK